MLKQTVIITGGNSGIGYHCARTIAADLDWQVILACRNLDKAQKAVEALITETCNQSIEAIELDLGSLVSIRKFSETLAEKRFLSLKAIVANAGTQVIGNISYTVDGFETTFAVNHLGHFLLINLLLKYLVPPARIIFVSSGTHNPNTIEGRFNPPCYVNAQFLAHPETTNSPKLSGLRRYSTSKLCNIFCAYELVRRLERAGYSQSQPLITVNVFDPGAVSGTGLTRDYNPLLRFLLTSPFLLRSLGVKINDVQTAGKALARLVLDPQLERVTGRYFQGFDEIPSSPESYDLAKAAELWNSSVEMVKLQPSEILFETSFR
jgi:light-dependent protochlorophyllide reductase